MQNDPANDYALAKLLNEYAIKIFTSLDVTGSIPDYSDLNRSYIFIVDELKEIYARQPELQKIGSSICWQVIDNLELFHENIGEYKTLEFEYTHSGADYGEEHNSKVSRLCIKAKIDKPDLTPHLQQLLEEADTNFTQYKHELDKMYATLSIESISVPVITVGDEKYHFPSTMRVGAPLNVITHCLEKHPNQQVDIDTLKSELKEAKMTANGLNNIYSNIRKTIFGEGNTLSPFVRAFPRAVLVRKTTELSDEELEAIKLAAS